MNLLIMTVSAGSGHIRAGEAVSEAVRQRFPASQIRVVDALKYINPLVDKLFMSTYIHSLKSTPGVYRKIYTMTETGEGLNELSRTINNMLSARVKELIDEVRPHVLLCTHPFSIQMASALKMKGLLDAPVVGLLTDYASHPQWLHPGIDAYVVAHRYMVGELVQRGVTEECIHPYGIPVRDNILKRKPKPQVRGELGLAQKTTALLMGGSLGMGEMTETFEALAACSHDMQIIAVAGSNTRLKKKLEKAAQQCSKEVHIFSYTNHIGDLMDASDFLVTKPGGMTVSEALVKELPLFLISPIPGHEERNAQFLVNNGIAARLSPEVSLDESLFQVLDNPLRLHHMREMSRYFARPAAAMEIADLLVRLSDLRHKTCRSS